MTITEIADAFESFLRNKFQSSDRAEEALKELRRHAMSARSCVNCKYDYIDSEDYPCNSCFSDKDYFEPRWME